MSVFGIDSGIPQTDQTAISGTSATTVLDATDRSYKTVVGILLTNKSGSALTPVVDYYDGTTAFVIRDNATLADQASESVTIPGFIRIYRDHLLRVTANTGLDVLVSYVETPSQQGRR